MGEDGTILMIDVSNSGNPATRTLAVSLSPDSSVLGDEWVAGLGQVYLGETENKAIRLTWLTFHNVPKRNLWNFSLHEGLYRKEL
jgi:hypothetical protein